MARYDENSKLRVFMTIPNLNIAGAQKMVEQLIGHIDYSTYEVRLAVQAEPKNTILERSVRNSGASVVFFNKKPGLRPRPFIQAWRELNYFRPNIIHTHVQSWVYLIPWVLFHEAKVLHTIHSRPARQENLMMRFIIKYFYRKSIFIPIAISDEIAKEAVTVYGLPPERIETVYNPVDVQIFQKTERIPHQTFNFVMVARFNALKNHLFILDVFADVCRNNKNTRLLLAGEGELLDAAKRKASELGIGDKVEFLGVVLDIPALLARSDVFLLPSLTEGMPMTLLEAEAAGLPVIASNVGGVPDVVDGNGFLVQVNDFDRFKECMVLLADSPGACAEMGIKSKEIVKKYDAADIADQYERLYEKYAKHS